jgi:DNA-nicking Smr family endonuclease
VSRKYQTTDEDLACFREAVKNVRPLKSQERIQPVKQNNPIRQKKFQESTLPEVEDFLSDHLGTTVSSGEKLFFTRGGLQHKLIRDFQQGKVIPEDSLDLHKMTVLQARQAMLYFLADSFAAGYRCVLIIHGKGQLTPEAPILKNQVNNWLQQYEDVLAFCSAAPRDGGVGAVYVLLRKVQMR